MCQRACKPGSVHACFHAMGDHSSRAAFTCGIQQPTRTTGRNTPYAVPIRSCSRWGLPCRFRYRSRGALLPHPFTVAGPKPSPSALCGTFPGVAPAGRYPAPLFRGARTFLGTRKTRATRPPGPLTPRRCSEARAALPAPPPQFVPRRISHHAAEESEETRAPAGQSSPCGRGNKSARRIMRSSASTSPSIISGRYRRWNAVTAARGSSMS